MASSWSKMRPCCPVCYRGEPGSGFSPEAVCPPDPGVEHEGTGTFRARRSRPTTPCCGISHVMSSRVIGLSSVCPALIVLLQVDVRDAGHGLLGFAGRRHPETAADVRAVLPSVSANIRSWRTYASA